MQQDMQLATKEHMPLDGNSLQSPVIYQASVTRKDNNTTEKFIGLTENDFKTRYRNHAASFRHAKHRNSTELSKNIWTLKDNEMETSPLNLSKNYFDHCTQIFDDKYSRYGSPVLCKLSIITVTFKHYCSATKYLSLEKKIYLFTFN